MEIKTKYNVIKVARFQPMTLMNFNMLLGGLYYPINTTITRRDMTSRLTD